MDNREHPSPTLSVGEAMSVATEEKVETDQDQQKQCVEEHKDNIHLVLGFEEEDDIPLAQLVDKDRQNVISSDVEATIASNLPLSLVVSDKGIVETCMDMLNNINSENDSFTLSDAEAMSLDGEDTGEGAGEFTGEEEKNKTDQDHQVENLGEPEYTVSPVPGFEEDDDVPLAQLVDKTDQNGLSAVPLRAEDHAVDGHFVKDKKRQQFVQEIDESEDTSERTRKRQVHPNSWKRNLAKRKKNKGLAYTRFKDGKNVPARKMGPPCNEKCNHKCSTKFSNDEREAIFNNYWACGSFERQRDYIAGNVNHKETTAKQRIPKVYHLTTDTKRVTVCKRFFLNTLGIKEKTVSYTLKKKSGEVLVKSDQRGKHTKRKTPVDVLQGVRNHINKFPCIESHYCRQTTKRKYLESGLSLPKMFEMYKNECEENGSEFASINVYRSTFNNEFNLGFHKPKKDQCATCASFESLSKEDQAKAQAKQDEHLKRKDRCREEKNNDKLRAQRDPLFGSYTFDLQQVLQTPCSRVSTLYYKRKLSSYNLTFYDQACQDGTCYVWNECMGKRGSTEIGTGLLKYLWSLPDSLNGVSFFSDCCGGQNRNQYVAAALNFAVRTIPHINFIDQKFLESGHTQMEVDSMHSAIEHAKKHVPIYHPDNWTSVLGMARRKNPYKVVQLSWEDFIDLHHLSEVLFNNVKKDVSGEAVNWLKIKMLRFTKDQPNVILFKYNFDDNFRTIKVCVSGRRKSSDALKKETQQAYKESLPVSEAKKNDLVSLCDSNIIPKAYHMFYRQLKTVRDQPNEE